MAGRRPRMTRAQPPEQTTTRCPSGGAGVHVVLVGGALPADDTRPTVAGASQPSAVQRTASRRFGEPASPMDDAEVRACPQPPARALFRRASPPSGRPSPGKSRRSTSSSKSWSARSSPGGARCEPPRGLSCQRSPATATIQHRALRRWSCSRARRRRSRRTSSDCTVQPSVGSPSRMRSCTS